MIQKKYIYIYIQRWRERFRERKRAPDMEEVFNGLPFSVHFPILPVGRR